MKIDKDTKALRDLQKAVRKYKAKEFRLMGIQPPWDDKKHKKRISHSKLNSRLDRVNNKINKLVTINRDLSIENKELRKQVNILEQQVGNKSRTKSALERQREMIRKYGRFVKEEL